LKLELSDLLILIIDTIKFFNIRIPRSALSAIRARTKTFIPFYSRNTILFRDKR